MTEKNLKLPNLGARHTSVTASPRNVVLDEVEGHIAEAKALHAEAATNQKPAPIVKRTSQANLLVQRKISQGQDPRRGARKFAALGRKVVTALTWKRVLGKPSEAPPPEETKEPDIDLPAHPRFCATLSLEAQYAMMKGYEDLLLTNLKENYPERAVFLPRTRTPTTTTKKIVDTDSDDSETEKLAALNLGSLVPVTNNEQVVAVTKHKPKDKGPKKKQLVITYRFQSAMDILDTIRDKNGHLVTSPRLKEKTLNPLDSYSSWKITWSKEFKFKSVQPTK
jgi:hypothetical protein